MTTNLHIIAEKQHSFSNLWRVVRREEPYEQVLADNIADEPTARLIAAVLAKEEAMP